MSRTIDYGNLMHHAMRGLIKTVLHDVQENGLPGSHHFFITFDTGHEDVMIANWLADRYPDEMTVVMQHWFDNLDVGDDGFSVTLNFGESPEPLYIPYDAIRTFVDPSVEFGLRFESPDASDDAPQPAAVPSLADPATAEPTEPGAPVDTPADADVVSLDSFRK